MRHWYQVPHASTVLPMPDQPRSRLLRSELERELGDLDGAEEGGRPNDAILFCNRLLDLWRDPDSDLVPVRDSIEARRNALVRATG